LLWLVRWGQSESQRAADRIAAAEAAAELVAALRHGIESETDSPADPISGTVLGAKVRELLSALSRQGLVPSTLSWESGISSALIDTENLDPAAAVFVLDALEQVLRTSRHIRPWPFAGRSSPTPAPVGAKPDEAALLGSLTERFYGSWAFRVVAGMLVVAAAFAIGGTALVGSQTFNLRQELKEQGDAAKKDITDLQSAYHVAVAAQAAEMKQQHDAAIREIKDGRTDITLQNAKLSEQEQALLKAIGAKRQEIDDYVKSLKTELHDASVPKVVAELRQQMESEKDSIKRQIVGPLEVVRDKDLVDVQAKLSALRSKIGTMSDQAADVARELASATSAVNGFGASIVRVNEAVKETDDAKGRIATNVTAIDTALANARRSESEASKAANLASADEQMASQERTSVASVVQRINDETPRELKALGATDDQIKTLNKGVTDLTNEIATLRDEMKGASGAFENARKAGLQAGAIASDLTSLRDRVDTMEKDLDSQRDHVDQARQTTAAVVDSAQRLNGIQLRVATIEPAVDTISTRSARISSRLDNAATDTGQLQGKVDVLAHSITELEKRVANLRAAVPANNVTTVVPTDGTSTSQTLDPLDNRPSKPEEIKAMQRALLKLNLYRGTIDAVDGPMTSRAEAAYQRQLHETVTGTLTRAQFDRLLGNH
jgi:chromosome segregation ATPase